jgi:hypothetical protein
VLLASHAKLISAAEALRVRKRVKQRTISPSFNRKKVAAYPLLHLPPLYEKIMGMPLSHWILGISCVLDFSLTPQCWC